MKKLASIIISVVLAASCFSFVSCKDNSKDGKISVVCTIFPEYDWVKNIIGEKENEYSLTVLMDNGVDMHSYQPTVTDIVNISECDLFIYVGGESDSWVDGALKNAADKNRKTINLMSVLGDKVKDEEHIDGAQDNSHDHDHDHDHEESEKDEHVWLSLKNAAICCDEIEKQLSSIDPDSESVYKTNLNLYKEKLTKLDGEFNAVVSNSYIDTLVFGDRFPFRYLFDDYGLKYYAAFSGCSAESEASIETIVFLANKIDELNLDSVCVIDGGNVRIAETVRDNTSSKSQTVVTFDSMQSLSSEEIYGNVTYLSLMEKNLVALKTALNFTTTESV